MKKIVVKIVAILIAGIVVASGSGVMAASTSQLKSEKQQNQEQINEKKEDLNNVKENKNKTINEVEDLTTQIGNYEEQISELNDKIDQIEKQIKEQEKKLKKSQEEYKEQEELLAERLIVLYENGETTYLDFILSSDSMTDFISNYYLASELANYDTELLGQMEQKQKEIEETKQKIEADKKEVETSKNQKQAKTTELEAIKSDKNKQVAKLSEDEQKIQEQIEELQEANVQIAKEIKAAQAKYAAQIAALENKKSSGGSSSSSSSSGGSSSSAPSGNGRLQRPVNSNNITATMYYPSGSYHGALDYGIPVGTPVYAADDGVVIKTANLTGSYGTYVVIQHSGGLQTWYAHGQRGSICVSAGQTVSRGQKIMNSGNTGNSTGPHLHFEVRVAPYSYNGCRVDPRNYF